MKVFFLDIDGVLQPRTSNRYEHRKEITAFCRMKDKRMKVFYLYVGWLVCSPYRFAARAVIGHCL